MLPRADVAVHVKTSIGGRRLAGRFVRGLHDAPCERYGVSGDYL